MNLTKRIERARVLREREEKKAEARAQAPANRRMGQLIAREQRREDLLDGKVQPRNSKEALLVFDAETREYL